MEINKIFAIKGEELGEKPPSFVDENCKNI
jgi:hypothetical protein